MGIMDQYVQLISAPGMILAEIARTRDQDKVFRAIKERLKNSYTPRELSKLQQKYMNNPDKFSAELDVLTARFIEDYTKFREGYGQLFGEIIHTLDIAEQGLHSGLFEVYQIIDTLEKIGESKPAKLYFPGGTTKKFHEEFNAAMTQLAKQLQKDYVYIEGLAKHKRTALGLYAAFVSRESARKKGESAASKLGVEVKKMKDVEAKIREELQRGIRQDFLLLLLQYVKEMTKTDELLQELKRDIEIMMKSILDEVEEIINAIAPFMIVVQREPTVGKKVETARGRFLYQQTKITEAIGKEGGWPRVQGADAQKLSEAERKLISILTGINEGAIRQEVSKLRNIEMGRA